MCPHHNNYYIVYDELFLYPSITCFTQIFPSLHQILMIFFVIQIKLYHVKCQLTLSNSYFDNLEFRVLNVNLFCGFSFLLRWIASARYAMYTLTFMLCTSSYEPTRVEKFGRGAGGEGGMVPSHKFFHWFNYNCVNFLCNIPISNFIPLNFISILRSFLSSTVILIIFTFVF